MTNWRGRLTRKIGEIACIPQSSAHRRSHERPGKPGGYRVAVIALAINAGRRIARCMILGDLREPQET